MCLPQETLNIGETSTRHHFVLLPPFSLPLPHLSRRRVESLSEVSSSTPAATPALIEPLQNEVMTESCPQPLSLDLQLK